MRAMAVVDPVAMNRASALLARLAAVGAAGLVLTGVPLLFVYEPSGGLHWLSTLHGLASMLFLGAAAGLLLAALAAAWARDRTWAGWALGLAAFVVAGAGALTGQLIAWDALDPASLGDGARGMFDPLADDVQSVVVGGTHLEPGVLARWTFVHALLVPVLVVAVGRPLWSRLRGWEDPGSDVDDAPGETDAETGSGEESGNQTAEA